MWVFQPARTKNQKNQPRIEFCPLKRNDNQFFSLTSQVTLDASGTGHTKQYVKEQSCSRKKKQFCCIFTQEVLRKSFIPQSNASWCREESEFLLLNWITLNKIHGNSPLWHTHTHPKNIWSVQLRFILLGEKTKILPILLTWNYISHVYWSLFVCHYDRLCVFWVILLQTHSLKT